MEQFYVVLPSNSSMQYYTDNTTTHFITKLPREVKVHGDWVVGLTEIQIPSTFQHFSNDETERAAAVEFAEAIFDEKSDFVNIFDLQFTAEDTHYVNPGVYSDVNSLIDEINNLEKNHLRVNVERGCFAKISRICSIDQCPSNLHILSFPDEIWKILGFEEKTRKRAGSMDFITIKNYDTVTGERPVNLAETLPNMIMIYGNILEPYVTGDVQSRLLRAVSLDIHQYNYGYLKVKAFSPPMYSPLLFNTFQAIEIDIRDQLGQPIPFSHGTLTVTLHFKRIQ